MKLWKLDALRGAAALYVAASHIVPLDLTILRFGQEAVMVFFLISGFAIEYSFSASRDTSFRTYFLKRFARIYSVLIPMFAVVFLLRYPDHDPHHTWSTLVGNLLMLQDFQDGKPHVLFPTLYTSALWSLHYEWWFYMLFYPISRFLEKSRQQVVVAGTAIVLSLLYLKFPWAPVRLLMYFPVWWTGVELARSYRAHGRVEPRDLTVSIATLTIISLVLGVNVITHLHAGGTLHLGVHPFIEFRHVAATLAAVLVALCWQRLHWVGFSCLKFGTWFAPISYSLYIGHQALCADATYLRSLQNPVLEFVLYLSVLLLFCLVTEVWLYPRIRKVIVDKTFLM